MVFRARKAWRMVAAAGAAATPSFGVGTSRAAAATDPIKTPPECGMNFDRLLSTDASTFRHCSETGVVTTIEVPAA